MLDELHVHHALDAVDRLLERRRDRALDRLRVGAGVERRDGDRRRRQVRDSARSAASGWRSRPPG